MLNASLLKQLTVIFLCFLQPACNQSPVPRQLLDDKLVVHTYEVGPNGQEIASSSDWILARKLTAGTDFGKVSQAPKSGQHLVSIENRIVEITPSAVLVEVRISHTRDFSSSNPKREELTERLVVPYDKAVQAHPLPTIFIEAHFEPTPRS